MMQYIGKANVAFPAVVGVITNMLDNRNIHQPVIM